MTHPRLNPLWIVPVLFALLLAACTATRHAVPGPDSDTSGLMQTDRNFARAARLNGVAAAFRAFAAEDATIFPIGGLPVQGRDAIFAVMNSGPKVDLEWSPEAAHVARGGDLGYTWGQFTVHGIRADGASVTNHGKYVTVWQRQPDGSWKFVADIGNLGPSPE